MNSIQYLEQLTDFDSLVSKARQNCVRLVEALYKNLDRIDRFTVNDRFTGKWIKIGETRLCDLFNLTAANWLEQRPRLPLDMQQFERHEFRKILPLLLPGAQTAVRTAYGFT
jgi:hypothetical protein